MHYDVGMIEEGNNLRFSPQIINALTVKSLCRTLFYSFKCFKCFNLKAKSFVN